VVFFHCNPNLIPRGFCQLTFGTGNYDMRYSPTSGFGRLCICWSGEEAPARNEHVLSVIEPIVVLHLRSQLDHRIPTNGSHFSMVFSNYDFDCVSFAFAFKFGTDTRKCNTLLNLYHCKHIRPPPLVHLPAARLSPARPHYLALRCLRPQLQLE
jgi:hypothetical protein